MTRGIWHAGTWRALPPRRSRTDSRTQGGACEVDVGQTQCDERSRGVLGQATVAHLVEAPQALDDRKDVFNPCPHPGLRAVDQTFENPRWDCQVELCGPCGRRRLEPSSRGSSRAARRRRAEPRPRPAFATLPVPPAVKEVFGPTAQRLRSIGAEHQARADKVQAAASHWLRHTMGSRLADGVDLRHIATTFGPSSLATTSINLHAGDYARRAALCARHRLGLETAIGARA